MMNVQWDNLWVHATWLTVYLAGLILLYLWKDGDK